MATRNDVTGDLIKSRSTNQEQYKSNWDRIFGKKEEPVEEVVPETKEEQE